MVDLIFKQSFQFTCSFITLQDYKRRIGQRTLILIFYSGLIMTQVEPKAVKADFKKYEKYGLYRRRTNVLVNDQPYTKGKRYLVELYFLGDLNKSLIDIFLCFFESIHEIQLPTSTISQRPLEYNKIFKFFVKAYFLHDRFLPRVVKASYNAVTAYLEVMGSSTISYLSESQSKAEIMALCSQTMQEAEQEYLNELKLMKRSPAACDEVDGLAIIDKIIIKQKLRVIQQILNIKQSSIRRLYIPGEIQSMGRAYLGKLLNTLLSTRFTKKIYRALKFQHFVQIKYKEYYKVDYVKTDNARSAGELKKKFILQRYTENENEYLTDMVNLASMRRGEVKYDEELFQSAKELLKELLRHQSLTNQAYPLLSPKAVIFNQLSLKTQLSYQNPLLQALGLLKRPVNPENMICFQATPTPYDTYANYFQLQNPDFLVNHVIGMNSLLKQRFCKTATIIDNNFDEIKSAEALKSQSWRFMMTVHFMMNGQEYYKSVGPSTFKKFEEFKEFVKQEEEKLRSQSELGFYLKLLGDKFVELLPQKQNPKLYNPKLTFFQNLLKQTEDCDSVIESFGMVKLNRHLKLYLPIMKEVLAITQIRIFAKTYNTVRYLLRFYLGIFTQMSQISILCEYFLSQQDIGLQLLLDYKQKSSLEGEGVKSYAAASYSKFKEYKKRQSRKSESQVTYLFQEYKAEFQSVEKYYELVKSLKKRVNNLSAQKHNQKRNAEQEEVNKEAVSEILGAIRENSSDLKAVIFTIISREFLAQKESNRGQQLAYYKNKLNLLTQIILSLSHQNFLTIQSLVLPALQSNQIYNSSEPPTQPSPQAFSLRSELCEYCLQILKEMCQIPTVVSDNSSRNNSKQSKGGKRGQQQNKNYNN